jgi:hypothetical protein
MNSYQLVKKASAPWTHFEDLDCGLLGFGSMESISLKTRISVIWVLTHTSGKRITDISEESVVSI